MDPTQRFLLREVFNFNFEFRCFVAFFGFLPNFGKMIRKLGDSLRAEVELCADEDGFTIDDSDGRRQDCVEDELQTELSFPRSGSTNKFGNGSKANAVAERFVEISTVCRNTLEFKLILKPPERCHFTN